MEKQVVDALSLALDWENGGCWVGVSSSVHTRDTPEPNLPSRSYPRGRASSVWTKLTLSHFGIWGTEQLIGLRVMCCTLRPKNGRGGECVFMSLDQDGRRKVRVGHSPLRTVTAVSISERDFVANARPTLAFLYFPHLLS